MVFQGFDKDTVQFECVELTYMVYKCVYVLTISIELEM